MNENLQNQDLKLNQIKNELLKKTTIKINNSNKKKISEIELSNATEIEKIFVIKQLLRNKGISKNNKDIKEMTINEFKKIYNIALNENNHSNDNTVVPLFQKPNENFNQVEININELIKKLENKYIVDDITNKIKEIAKDKSTVGNFNQNNLSKKGINTKNIKFFIFYCPNPNYKFINIFRNISEEKKLILIKQYINNKNTISNSTKFIEEELPSEEMAVDYSFIFTTQIPDILLYNYNNNPNNFKNYIERNNFKEYYTNYKNYDSIKEKYNTKIYAVYYSRRLINYAKK